MVASVDDSTAVTFMSTSFGRPWRPRTECHRIVLSEQYVWSNRGSLCVIPRGPVIQRNEVLRDFARSLESVPGLEQAKALPVPADDGRGFDDQDAGLPIRSRRRSAKPRRTDPPGSVWVAGRSVAERRVEWRRARISSCSAARLRKEAKSAAKKADNRSPKENRRKNDNSQFINQIGVCENHRLLTPSRASSGSVL
jgi:hypothetical protein